MCFVNWNDEFAFNADRVLYIETHLNQKDVRLVFGTDGVSEDFDQILTDTSVKEVLKYINNAKKKGNN